MFIFVFFKDVFLLWSNRTPVLREEKLAFISRGDGKLPSFICTYPAPSDACKSTLNCSVPHEVSTPSLTLLHCETVITEGSNPRFSVADLENVSLRVDTIFIKIENYIYILMVL